MTHEQKKMKMSSEKTSVRPLDTLREKHLVLIVAAE